MRKGANVQIDGTYGFVYCGVNGIGIGALVVEGGKVQGHDYAGGSYTGTAASLLNGIDVDLKMVVPAGGELVQGTAAQEIPYERQIKHRVSSSVRRWRARSSAESTGRNNRYDQTYP